jgi:pSer/pThr/pTyr-binding forkhead associated (FHA) protein
MLLSRRHCRLQLRPDGSLQVEDLASLNGTFVEGPLLNGHKHMQKLQPHVPAVLQAGDMLMLGGKDTVLGLSNQIVNNPFKFLVSTACADVVATTAAGQQVCAAAAVAGAVERRKGQAATATTANIPSQAQQGSLQVSL